MIYWITCCHAPVRIMRQTRARLRKTMDGGQIDRMVFVDHRYPLEQAENGAFIKDWAEEWSADVICPPENLGGHGGDNYALRFLRPENDSDIVFIIDPDSYPIEDGWFQACVQALDNDPKLGAISLVDRRIQERPWKIEDVFAPRVAFLSKPEMWNMTAFRFGVLREGLKADTKFYGFVETAMWSHLGKLGLRHGYLIDFTEGANPEAHDPEYVQWKDMHAHGVYPHNFDRYCREEVRRQ